MGLPLRVGDCLQPGRKVVTYLQEPTKAWQIKGWLQLHQFPLLNQIWDPLPGKQDAEVWSPPRDARNVTVPNWGLAQVH